MVEELAAIATANVKDFSTWNGGALTLTPSEKIPRRLSRAIAEVSYDVRPDGSSKTKIKLHSKTDSLRQLSEILGLPKSRLIVEDKRALPLTEALQEIWARKGDNMIEGNVVEVPSHASLKPSTYSHDAECTLEPERVIY